MDIYLSIVKFLIKKNKYFFLFFSFYIGISKKSNETHLYLERYKKNGIIIHYAHNKQLRLIVEKVVEATIVFSLEKEKKK
jgi:hypothetical protein